MTTRPIRAFITNIYLQNGEKESEMSHRLQSHLALSSISVTSDIVVRKIPNGSSTGRQACFALVPCNVNMAIKCLNNTQYDGHILKVTKEVPKEKREQQKEWNGSAGFGGGWQGGDGPGGSGSKKRRSKKKKSKKVDEASDKSNAPPSSLSTAASVPLTASAAPLPPAAPNSSADSVDAFNSRLNQPLSALMADYGDYEPLDESSTSAHSEINAEADIAPPPPLTSTSATKSMLMPRSSAPIHITISSFGFLFGCPSSKSVTPSDPLPAFDCRQIQEVSKGVERLSGLSAVVRREILRNADAANSQTPTWELIHKIAKDATDSVVASINEDGAGWASPLSMKVFIGSHNGRHRSVAIAEASAIAVRNLLRKNEGNRFTVVCR